MLMKVCGVTCERDIETLAAAGADLVGLWHGVPGGEADLDDARLVRLAAAARESRVEPVLVTFAPDARRIARALALSGVAWLQLHAFQLPRLVAELRAITRPRRLTIVKVLHVSGERCVDVRLVPAYEAAGVDAFLLDATSTDGRVGSTGVAIPPAVASAVAERLRRPFFLAGGVTARSRARYGEVARRRGFVGIDVSTAARDADGALRARRIEAVGRAWRGGLEDGCLSSSIAC